ncbi:hypothetical protein [Deinococcus alpinitundrae]|uniref:hypothetical protein n=1 Tax=Deinococcus alpinitundrae TaxID=468913 RepID=UPI0027B9E981|nr:hypothetical protein [Deinococcus alpinitundrae]
MAATAPTTAAFLRHQLGKYSSIVCFRAMISSVENTLSPDARPARRRPCPGETQDTVCVGQ